MSPHRHTSPTPDPARWEIATRRQARALEEAGRRYPRANGYVHDPESNGWPDVRCQVAVYRRVPDRRYRDGWRLDRVATCYGAEEVRP